MSILTRKGEDAVMEDSQVRLRDGRALAYTDIGEPGWPCVVFCHGAPMSRLHLAYLEEALRAERVRVVSPDRPSVRRIVAADRAGDGRLAG